MKTHQRYIGENLRRLRTAQKLSLYRLGKLATHSPRHIQEYERGDKMPGAETLCKLSHALGVSIDDFFQPRGPREKKNGNRA